MKNLKRVLSLVLALMMALSLMAFSSSASAAESTTIPVASEYDDYNDVDDAYKEAVDVTVALGITKGKTDTTLDPEGTLTRAEAVIMIMRILLGDTAAESMSGSTSRIFLDVGAEFPYGDLIAYAANTGIVSGDAGSKQFFPTDTLNVVSFGKILLGALGYDGDKEGYTGATWYINVFADMATAGIELDGVTDPFANLTREQAMQMTFQALQAALVEYPTNTINGAAMATRNGATYVTSALAREQRINNRQLTGNTGWTVEFAEKYFPSLWLSGSTTASAGSSSVYRTDVFGRPAHTWTYKTHDIDTYTDDDLFIDEFTGGVTNAEMSQTLGYSRISDYVMSVYVDGALLNSTATDAIKANLTKTSESKKNVDGTGNGVKTEVYVDHNPIYKSGTAMTGEITIVIINTWLAEVTATDTLKVYTGTQGTGTDFNLSVIKTKTALGADASLSGFNKGDMVQVTMAADNHVGAGDNYEDYSVESVKDVEKVTDATITAYTLQKVKTTDDTVVQCLSTLTADGTKYNAANKAFYDANVLYNYNDDRSELSESIFDVYLTDDGFVLGVKEVESANNYIFVVSWENDGNFSDVANAIDRAAIITTSGEMKIVNITDKNVKVYGPAGYTGKWVSALDPDGNDATNNPVSGYPLIDHKAVNKWYTYTIDSNGTYILLKEVDRQGRYAVSGSNINNTNISLGNGSSGSARVYGNDNSTYITVKTAGEGGWSSGGTQSISDVLQTTTGIKNTNIQPITVTGGQNTFYMYDANNYVTYAVVVGRALGTSQMVYFTGGVTGREVKDVDGKTYVGYNAILNNEETEVFVLDSVATLRNPKADGLFAAEFDSNGYITKLSTTEDTYRRDSVSTAINRMNGTDPDGNRYGYAQATAVSADEEITLSDSERTLYIRSDAVAKILTSNPQGWIRIGDSCTVFLKSYNSNTYEKLTYAEATERYAQDLAANPNMYIIKVAAICETSEGTATTLVIVESTETLPPYKTGTTATTSYNLSLSGINLYITYSEDDVLGAQGAIKKYLESKGYSNVTVQVKNDNTIGAVTGDNDNGSVIFVVNDVVVTTPTATEAGVSALSGFVSTGVEVTVDAENKTLKLSGKLTSIDGDNDNSDLKAALGWFSGVDERTASDFKELYDLANDSFGYVIVTAGDEAVALLIGQRGASEHSWSSDNPLNSKHVVAKNGEMGIVLRTNSGEHNGEVVFLSQYYWAAADLIIDVSDLNLTSSN